MYFVQPAAAAWNVAAISAQLIGCTSNLQVKDPKMATETIQEAVSENGEMVDYLKNNNVELAAQRATAVLSVVNHAPPRDMKLVDKMEVRW